MNQPASRRPRSQAGFTMIEVMVAVLLTAIATSGIIGLYMVETRASGFSRHNTEATVLAEDMLEHLRTRPTVLPATPEASLNESGTVVAGGMFTRSYVITPGSGLTQPYDDLLVTIMWVEDGVTRTITMRGRRNQ
jgi:prepilin-type N-terminal cleavage/methylation domain-containing protein